MNVRWFGKQWFGKQRGGKSRIPSRSTQVLVLHLDSECPALTVLDRTGSSWQASRHIELKVDHDEPYQAALGESLLEALGTQPVAATDMIVSVPLSRLLLKHFTVPFVGNDQIAGTVALEAEARDLAPDRFVVDYDFRIDEKQRLVHASVFALRQEIRQEIELAAEVANLRLLSIGIGELSLAKHITNNNQSTVPETAAPNSTAPNSTASNSTASNSTATSPTAASLVALAHPRYIQMMAVESQLVTKSLWFPREENPSVLSRALTNHSLRFQAASGDNRPVSKVNLLALGDGADQLVSDLNSQAAIMAALPEFGRQPAHPILASALAEELANEPDCLLEPINFLKPKRTAQAVPVWRSNLRTWGVRAALAGVLLFLVSHAFARHLDFRIRDLQARIEAADVQSATQRNKVEQAQQLARWHASRTNWSETLPHTLLQFPNNERIYLSMIRLEQGDASPASLRFEGLAREIEDAIDLNRKLLQHSDALELQPDRIDHEENDPHYRARFTITATVKAAGVSDPTDAERAK